MDTFDQLDPATADSLRLMQAQIELLTRLMLGLVEQTPGGAEFLLALLEKSRYEITNAEASPWATAVHKAARAIERKRV